MLTGSLVGLRAIAPDDHDALFELESDLATWELRGPRPPVPPDRATWDERLPARLRGDDGGIRFAIEAEGGFVGSCMLMDVDGLLASNAAGRASYAKVGFVEGGRRREHAWVDGAYEDEVLMGLLRGELGPG